MKRLFVLIMSVIPCVIYAQLQGEINYDKLGISFTIPTDWVGQEGDGFVLLGSYTIPGFITVSTHNTDLEGLKKEAAQGIYDQASGMQLQLSGNLELQSKSQVSGYFDGTVEWQPARAYIIGIVSAYGGPGVTIMAAAAQGEFGEAQVTAAKALAQSVVFKKVDRTAELRQWKELLSNVRLTYMSSYYSSGSGSYGGYSSETKIDLCAQGYFLSSSSSSMSVGSEGVSGYSAGQGGGDGSWKVVIGSSGEPTLLLSYANGDESEYTLEMRGEELYMNGDRFFRTTSGEYAPACY